MKAYIVTSAAIFGLITVAHLVRIMMEGARLASEPVYILLTLASAALSVWGWYVLRQAKR
jgi:hypothetical protein